MENPTDQTLIVDLSQKTPAELARAFIEITAALTTGDLASLTRELGAHYAGGPDGPIREPGDDMPSVGDVYSNDELCEQLDKHRARVVKLGLYDIAADLNMARDRLEHLFGIEADLESLNKQVHALAAEKRQAQEWIAALRSMIDSQESTIATLSARIGELSK